ncbi:2-octaprenyl-6-methoxyphenyl hydroxylase [Neptunomonas phycophila]|uniref:2-octaprenyl-6-methoxyphenyl hydroxylase n=1 Tax=Neptunomonas phycophila TaxID=1572645 RepID=UPI0030F8726C
MTEKSNKEASAAVQTFDIVIIGGGMVGASLAAALLSAAQSLDLQIAMIESQPLPDDDLTVYQPSYDARATALSYGTRSLYEHIGVWPAIAEQATPITHIHVSDKGHFGAARLSAEQEKVPALGYVVENHWLGRVLLNHLQTHTNHERLTPICPAHVSHVARVESGMEVTVDINGVEQVIRAALVVMADGGRSDLREQLGIGYQQTQYDQHAVVAVISPDRSHKNIAYERFTPDGPVAVLPLATHDQDNRCGLVWTVPSDELEETLAMSDDAFIAKVQERFGYRAGRFVKVGERFSYPLKKVVADEQVRSGLAILGNAAHALHPIAGQGYNLALRGVVALAQQLIDARQRGVGLGDLTMLQAYYRARIDDQERTIGLSDKTMRLFSNTNPLLALGRDVGLQAMDICPIAKTIFARGAMGLDIPAPDLTAS